MVAIEKVVAAFDVEGKVVEYIPFGNGHINDTRLVTMDNGVQYVLQRINKNVFKRPDLLMENYVGVTKFIRKKIEEMGGDPLREVLNAIPAKDGKPFTIDEEGQYWRLLVYVTESMSYDKVERPEQFYDSAVSFGDFQYMLRDYPAETLHETIVNFHNTPDRFRQLTEAIENDAKGRLAEVQAEVEFAKAREEFAGTLERARAEGKLPLRVTHNDTKLNNILFDDETNEGICVIDLDTIMPGFSLYDFGDAIRFGGNTTREDDDNLDNVNISLELFESYAEGFLSASAKALTIDEVENLAFSAKLMTLECGIRFLSDYLDGDVYFRTHYAEHNLVRARNQFKLVYEIEQNMDEMNDIVMKIYNKYK